MKLLNRESLLAKEKLDIVKVDLGNDEYVFVRAMTGHERDHWEQSLIKRTKDAKGKTSYDQSLDDFRAKLVVNTICDEDGNLLLKPGDYPTLSNNMSAKKLEAIVNKSLELNDISEEDKEALVKNSDADQVGNSTSASVEN